MPDFRDTINGITFVDVKGFLRRDNRMGNLWFRITKSGRVNLRDVKQWMKDGWLVPMRYTVFGIHQSNPDLGWPPEIIFDGVPEEFALAGLTDEAMASMRLKLREGPHDWSDEW